MGSDAEHKNELEPAVVVGADLYVADRVAQSRIQGELRAAIAAGTMEDIAYPELGQVAAGVHPGRTDARQITLADLTGTGVQDTAIATLALARADEAGLGTIFES